MIISFGNASLNLRQILTSDLSYDGIVCSDALINNNPIGFGCLLYVNSNGEYYPTNTNSDTTMPVRALALSTGTGTKSVLLNGFVRNNNWNFTIGKTLYASSSTGLITETSPSGANYKIQPIGYTVDSNILYFNPSLFLMTIKS